MTIYDAIILAGGKATRLGGVDKPSLDVAGVSMLERVLAACASARHIVVVGESRQTSRPVTWTLEEPPYGGPLAALGAGVAELAGDSECVAVFAADMPFLTRDTVGELLDALAVGDAASAGRDPALLGPDAALLVDDDGTAQPLAGVYDAQALTIALGACGELHGQPARRVVEPMRIVTVAGAMAAHDCDTADQLDEARRALATASSDVTTRSARV